MLLIPQRYEFSSKSQPMPKAADQLFVVVDTTKVRIFKQITTSINRELQINMLLLIPQRYEFSSKSQLSANVDKPASSCCWYHKGTNFQANHNPLCLFVISSLLLLIPQRYEFSSKSQPYLQMYLLNGVVVDTTKVRIFKQITTNITFYFVIACCCWYHKGTNFQANHNVSIKNN